MSFKLLIKYLVMYLPVILGVVLFSSGVVNLFSSLLLFLGGYIAIKNTLDYRLVKKNLKSVKSINQESIKLNIGNYSDNVFERQIIKPKKSDDIIGLKRVRRYSRVRRKY